MEEQNLRGQGDIGLPISRVERLEFQQISRAERLEFQQHQGKSLEQYFELLCGPIVLSENRQVPRVGSKSLIRILVAPVLVAPVLVAPSTRKASGRFRCAIGEFHQGE